MTRPFLIMSLGLSTMAGCVDLEGFEAEDASTNPPLPEEVLAVADPRQNLNAALYVPEDRCFWYEHRNVVETTLLPLRTRDGRHICVAEEAAAEDPGTEG